MLVASLSWILKSIQCAAKTHREIAKSFVLRTKHRVNLLSLQILDNIMQTVTCTSKFEKQTQTYWLFGKFEDFEI